MEINTVRPGRKALWILLGGLGTLILIGSAVVYFGIIMPVKGYISESAFPIHHVPVSRAAEKKAMDKVTVFFQEEKQDTLHLDSREVNHLLRTSRVIADYKVQYLVELQDSLFNLKCSVPVRSLRTHLSGLIDALNLEGYINAEMEGYVRLRDGKLTVISTRSQMNGREAPFTLLGKRTHIDVGDFLKGNPAYHSALAGIASVRIRGGLLELVLKPRGQS